MKSNIIGIVFQFIKMHILCTICSDLVNQSENIYVTKCGHIFHHHCLEQWIVRSKTCPQCRNKVSDRCMFRMYPTISNEIIGDNEDGAVLQSRLDNVMLELREEKAKVQKKEETIASLSSEQKELDEHLSSLKTQLLIYSSKVKALHEQLSSAKEEIKEAKAIKDQNEIMKKDLRIMYGLQRVLYSTFEEVEQMLQGYSDVRTMATFATALKRALCESEVKKNEFRDKLHQTKQQMALDKKNEADLQNKVRQLEAELKDSDSTIESLREELKTAALKKSSTAPSMQDHTPQNVEKKMIYDTPGLNDAILEPDLSNNSSFATMVNKIENSESPYLNLKHGSMLSVAALRRTPVRVANGLKHSIRNAAKKELESQTAAISIFHRKEPMKLESFDAKAPLDISYDGMGGHSKLDTFPTPKKSPVKSCIPRLTAKHKLKRPNTTANQSLFKKRKDK